MNRLFLAPAVRFAGTVVADDLAEVGIGACVIPGRRLGRAARVAAGAVAAEIAPITRAIGEKVSRNDSEAGPRSPNRGNTKAISAVVNRKAARAWRGVIHRICLPSLFNFLNTRLPPMEKAMKDAMLQGMGLGMGSKMLDKDQKEEENNGNRMD